VLSVMGVALFCLVVVIQNRVLTWRSSAA
jgi:hypothetical protein